MTYKIVFSLESITDLENQVNAMIGQGWRLQGGLAITSHVFDAIGPSPTLIYCQAMVKE